MLLLRRLGCFFMRVEVSDAKILSCVSTPSYAGSQCLTISPFSFVVSTSCAHLESSPPVFFGYFVFQGPASLCGLFDEELALRQHLQSCPTTDRVQNFRLVIFGHNASLFGQPAARLAYELSS